MIVERKFARAILTHQIGLEHMMLVIQPHPSVGGCCLLTILDSKEIIIAPQLTILNSELKKVADMLCGIHVD